MRPLLLFFMVTLVVQAYSQTNCDNIGFENGNFDNWTAYTGHSEFNNWVQGLQDGRHTIVSQITTDPRTNGQLLMVNPFGGGYSVKLGNEFVGSQAEALERDFLVTTEESAIILFYAVVFQDPGHDDADQPKFSLQIYDESGSPISGACFEYSVTASSNIPGFMPADDEVWYRNWTPLAVDLADYIGQTVTIRLETRDCNLGGHFGYAYFDAICGNLEVSVYDCGNDGAILAAPPGFVNFSWSTGATESFIIVDDPQAGQTYSVTASTEASCVVHMSYTFPEVPVYSDPPTLNSTECSVPGYVSLSAPSGFTSYLWSNGDTAPTTVYTDAFEGDTISVAIAGGAYCDTTLFYVVDTLPAFNQDTIFNTKYVCTGTAVDSITFGQGFIAVIWEDGSMRTNYVFENPQQDQQISVNAVPPLGCPITYIFTIEIVDPSQSLANQYFFCPSIDDITLRAPEGYSSYFWPDVQSSNIEISYPNPLANDSVSVYCTGQSSSGGCPLELIYILREYSLVQDDTVSSIVKICPYQETVDLEAQTGFSDVFWPLTGDHSLQITHQIQHDELQVELNMTDENDCEYVKFFNLEYFPPPADTTIDIGQYCITSNQVDIFAPVVYYQYQWSVNGSLQNDTNAIFDYKNPSPLDEIKVAFIDSFNCLRYYTTDLNLNMLPATLVENPIPNVFSPIPADGLNDVMLFPFHDFEFYRLEILNRWGETVYTVEGNIGPIQWDGKNWAGKIVPGTYFYKISLSACNAPELDFYQGFVHLVGENE